MPMRERLSFYEKKLPVAVRDYDGQKYNFLRNIIELTLPRVVAIGGFRRYILRQK